MRKILEQLGQFGVVPVVAIADAADAVPLGKALSAGGLPCAEITFRTAAAAAAIEAISSQCPEVLVGAGTVLTITQAKSAVAAGARFLVTPGFDPSVVDWSMEHQVPIIPGVMTPTEINMALKKGIYLLKFFPAEAAGGVKTLKAIGAPYGKVKFMPTGGISPANLPEYLALPMVHACGGSWLVKKQLIAAGQFDQISRQAAEAVAIVNEARSLA